MHSRYYEMLESIIFVSFGSYVQPKWFLSIITLMILNSILLHRFKDLFGTNLKRIFSELITDIFIIVTILFASRILSEALDFEKLMIGVITTIIVKEMLALLLMLKEKTKYEQNPQKKKLNNLMFNKLFSLFANAAGMDLRNTSDDPFDQHQGTNNMNQEIINKNAQDNKVDKTMSHQDFDDPRGS